MKEYRLVAWPELPAPYHRTAYRRMVSDMSHRFMSIQRLIDTSGLGRHEVRQFIDVLETRGLLEERHGTEPDSIFDSLRPLGGWIRRALSPNAEGH